MKQINIQKESKEVLKHFTFLYAKSVTLVYQTIRNMFNEISLKLCGQKTATAILSICNVSRRAQFGRTFSTERRHCDESMRLIVFDNTDIWRDHHGEISFLEALSTKSGTT